MLNLAAFYLCNLEGQQRKKSAWEPKCAQIVLKSQVLSFYPQMLKSLREGLWLKIRPDH